MELEQQLREALAPRSSGTAVREAVLARLTAGAAQLPTQPQGSRSSRQRLFLIGSVVALAAAAAVIAVSWRGWGRSVPSASTQTIADLLPVVTPDADAALEVAAQATALESGSRSARDEGEQAANVARALPLVPAPAAAPAPSRERVALVMQKAVERHPELVRGPELEGTATFMVSVAMRTSGAVLDSSAALATPATFTEMAARQQALLPSGGGESIATTFDSGRILPDGTALRARVFLRAVLIPDSFDLARSDVRVRKILGHQYDHLVTSTGDDEFNLLTILLSDDGRIVREKAERVTMQNAAVVMGLGTGAREEEIIASKLAISPGLIGQVGRTELRLGSAKVVVDANGSRRLEGVRRLSVRYAWARRADEPASIHAPPADSRSDADFDLDAALLVVERHLPDAFSSAPPSISDLTIRPTVVFTRKGEFVRAGRVQMRNGVDVDSLLQEQLVPGVSTSLHRSVRLTNKAGATAMVTFGWAE